MGAALNATINACPLRNETELSDLLVNAPELANPLVGYHGAAAALWCAALWGSVGRWCAPHVTQRCAMRTALPRPAPAPAPPAVLRGLWPTNTLQPGAAINSSDTIDKVGLSSMLPWSPASSLGWGCEDHV